jgi:hypothetical protein
LLRALFLPRARRFTEIGGILGALHVINRVMLRERGRAADCWDVSGLLKPNRFDAKERSLEEWLSQSLQRCEQSAVKCDSSKARYPIASNRMENKNLRLLVDPEH